MNCRQNLADRITMPLRLLPIIAILLWPAPPAQALTPLPEVGVDYQQMKVNDPDALRRQGMSKARKGDDVKLESSENQELILRNQRTGETIIVIPAGRR